MAAGSLNLFLTNGQKVSVYIASTQAINTPCRMSIANEATSTSPFTFTVLGNTCIRDIINLTNATGEVEVVADGVRTGKKIGLGAQFAYDTVNRTDRIPRYCFRPGVSYGFWMTVAQT